MSIGAQLWVIGDGSGTTPTGQGTMVLSAISLDNAPTESLLTSNVPEPASWATMAGGFGLLGAALRRRRRRPSRPDRGGRNDSRPSTHSAQPQAH